MKPKIKFDKSLIILVLIIVIVAMAIFLIVRYTRTDRITEMIENKKDINSVFLVHDKDELLFTEILFYSTATGKGALLDVPGETGVIIEKLGKIDRIDKLYDPEKPEEYIHAVENMIEQEIQYYYQIELNDLVKLVDIIGGVEMFIDNPVEIIDDEQTALLPSGSIVLDGDKTKIFVTYFDPDESEVEISSRREKTVQALLKGFQQKGEMIVGNGMYSHFNKTIDTNADDSSMKAFVGEMGKLDTERIVFQRVLGVRRTVDDQILLFSHYDGNLLRETVRQTITSLANVAVVSDEELNISIEILNGTEINGLASRTSQVFQSFGYDVDHIANYERNDVEKTFVIDRRGDINQAQRIANIIQCANIESSDTVSDEINETFGENPDEYDLVIILGKDFDGRYCK